MPKFLIFLLLSMLGNGVWGQDIQRFIDKTNKYAASVPQEKVYLQFNKPSFAAGETIFFKSYTVQGIHNLISSLSGVLYVELINPADQLMDRKMISTPLGVGLGDFELSDTIPEGRYRVRAYTNWMKNFGSDYFFEQPIDIYNGRTDDILTETSYSIREKDILYSIKLINGKREAIPKTRVSYQILEGEKVVEDKGATTNESGVIEIPVQNKYKSPTVKLRFVNANKYPVNKIIKAVDGYRNYNTQLFPEGGRLLSGFLNTIAVKSLDSRGLGVAAKVIFTKENDTLGSVTTNELGMGAAPIFLSDTTTFKATVIYKDGSTEVIPIPRIQQSGYSIVVNNSNGDRLFTQINVSADLINKKDIYFVLHHQGEILYVSKAGLNKQEMVFSVEKSKLPLGVVTVAILNEYFVPVVERPVFIYKYGNTAQIQLDKSSYKPREKVQVEFSLLGSQENKFGAFSAAVYDISKVNASNINQTNILSALFLGSDIKGHIEKPQFYFDDQNNVKLQDVDYLLLTQGWRNVEWEKINTPISLEYKAEKNLSISGYTKRYARSKPYPNAQLQLISARNFMDFLDTTANENGYFEFDNLVFPDSIKFLISAKDPQTGKNNIDIVYEERAPYPINSVGGDLVAWDVNRQYKNDLQSSKEHFSELERMGLKEKAIAIEEVVVTRRKRKVTENSSNLNGPGFADQVLGEEDLGTCLSLQWCLEGRILGVYWENGVPYNTRSQGEMQVILDGMPIDGDQVNNINVTDIESVEILRNTQYTAIYGGAGANGVIIITSKTGQSAMRSVEPKGLITIAPGGFHVPKTYYVPAYDVDDAIKFNKDVRASIHWEPSIVTDTHGKATFSFYTSDSDSNYIMIIEGVDVNGNVIRKVETIKR